MPQAPNDPNGFSCLLIFKHRLLNTKAGSFSIIFACARQESSHFGKYLKKHKSPAIFPGFGNYPDIVRWIKVETAATLSRTALAQKGITLMPRAALTESYPS
jgi:hypothetical protein